MAINLLEIIFFTYIFIGLYTLNLFILLYLPNRDRLFYYPKAKKYYPVSIVMPCYNEEKTIGEAIESLLKLDYPGKTEIIVVDDRSKDNSVKVIQGYVKKYSNVRLIINDKNSGGAAEPTNVGVKNAKYDFIAVADADSMPDPDALKKMIGFLDEERVAAVTCAVLARNPKGFLQKIQGIEYTVIAFTRKLLDFVDSVYVTPGPFALYKKKALLEVGLFDTKNLTQDIEIVWRLLSHGYNARMALSAKVYSETPRKFGAWFKQRVRWNIGGTQTLLKYKHLVFRRGMLGAFIIPLFAVSLFLGVFGLGIFAYLFARRTLVSVLSTSYSLAAQSSVFYLQDLTFSASILNYFGIALFVSGALFSIAGLTVMNTFGKGDRNIFNLIFYLIVYLTLQPIIIIVGMVKLVTGRYSW